MLTKIGRAVFAPDQRVLVTSDIHGHCDQLRQLLEKASYAPEKDVLVIVGDMLEKGWQNLETLRFVMHLSETGKVYTLIGNADTGAGRSGMRCAVSSGSRTIQTWTTTRRSCVPKYI